MDTYRSHFGRGSGFSVLSSWPRGGAWSLRALGVFGLAFALTGFHLGGATAWAEEKAPIPPASVAPPAVAQPLPDVSGAVRWRNSSVLVVHDAKAGLQDALPRIGLIDLTKPRGGYTTLVWPTSEVLPNDLESICAVPGVKDEFLVAESGYYRPRDAAPDAPPKYGRVFWISLEAADATALPVVKVKKTFQWPKGVKELEEIEGIACVPCGTKTVLIAANRYGTLLFGSVDLATDTEFKLPGILPLKERFPSLTDKFGRLASDLHVDEKRQLWTVATYEPPEEGPGLGTGPFRSAVYPLGSLTDDPEAPIRFSVDPVGTYAIGGLKVEGLTSIDVPNSFFIGTDDESFGGIWRILEKK